MGGEKCVCYWHLERLPGGGGRLRYCLFRCSSRWSLAEGVAADGRVHTGTAQWSWVLFHMKDWMPGFIDVGNNPETAQNLGISDAWTWAHLTFSSCGAQLLSIDLPDHTQSLLGALQEAWYISLVAVRKAALRPAGDSLCVEVLHLSCLSMSQHCLEAQSHRISVSHGFAGCTLGCTLHQDVPQNGFV